MAKLHMNGTSKMHLEKLAGVHFTMSVDAAKIAGRSPLFQMHAEKVAVWARARWALHDSPRDPHSVAATVDVKMDRGPYGVMDRVISVQHPYIIPIEYGHVGRNGFVQGLHIMRDVAQMFKR